MTKPNKSAVPSIIPANGHGEDATPDDESRHARFPHLNPLPEGEEANESLREFHVKVISLTSFKFQCRHHSYLMSLELQFTSAVVGKRDVSCGCQVKYF